MGLWFIICLAQGWVLFYLYHGSSAAWAACCATSPLQLALLSSFRQCPSLAHLLLAMWALGVWLPYTVMRCPTGQYWEDFVAEPSTSGNYSFPDGWTTTNEIGSFSFQLWWFHWGCFSADWSHVMMNCYSILVDEASVWSIPRLARPCGLRSCQIDEIFGRHSVNCQFDNQSEVVCKINGSSEFAMVFMQ